MSEMVERVGAAIQAAINSGAKSPIGTATFDDLARAAIEAMREPTEAMMTSPGTETWRKLPVIWRAMIDGAMG